MTKPKRPKPTPPPQFGALAAAFSDPAKTAANAAPARNDRVPPFLRDDYTPPAGQDSRQAPQEASPAPAAAPEAPEQAKAPPAPSKAARTRSGKPKEVKVETVVEAPPVDDRHLDLDDIPVKRKPGRPKADVELVNQTFSFRADHLAELHRITAAEYGRLGRKVVPSEVLRSLLDIAFEQVRKSGEKVLP
ncbi:hypothetical protein JJL56_31640 [Azospirillum sp. YIM DDC1]|uniref:Stability/partitioning determinant n=1 Tax=Azospirillum aestuarii TaxID=2802052 RepID=A0ABS1I8J5_9PROT|nr:hypothetical protein [Azospirillum aestuarii]MBK4723406.1 hypothetical protein [Azospirillum aestuarii]